MSFGSGPRPGVGGCPGFATERNSKYPATASTIAAFAVSTPLGRMEVGNPAVPPKELVDAILKDNRTEEFEKLRGAPGICLDPVPWDTARQLVQENSVESLSKLGRHPAGIVQYRSFRSKILGSYVTAGDYIKITILQHSSSLNSDGKRVAENSTPVSHPVWRENDFPYNFEEGVRHYNVWSAEPLTHEKLIKEIDQYTQGCEYIHFVNPFPLASIPAVWHAHVLTRPRRQN